MNNSLAQRLAITIALILSASGVVVTLAAYAYGREAAEAAYDRLLAGAAFQIAQSISVSPEEMSFLASPRSQNPRSS